MRCNDWKRIGLTLALLGASSLASVAEECSISINPDRNRGVLGNMTFYNFGQHFELQIETPSQPEGVEFRVALDGEETPDVLVYPGMDDLVLSLAPHNGDIAIDLAFVTGVLKGSELTVIGFRETAIATLANYDLRELQTKLAACDLK